MYDYGELELSILCCFWLKPSLLDKTKLEEKYFKYNRRIFVLFKSFYKKFGNLNVEAMCSLINDRYKLMDYMKVIINQKATPNDFENLEKLLLEMYEEAKEEQWLREKVFELANDFYLKNINSEEFKKQFDSLYTNKKEIFKNT